MPTPFPGMDPYLEAHWRDVLSRLIIYAADALQGNLPGSLRARVEERVLLETPEGIGKHPLYPDVRVVEYKPAIKRGVEAGLESGIAVAEPVVVEVGLETVTESFLQIIDPGSGNRIITIIEFLSPSNKSPGPNREQYLQKQREICASEVNLVEIDLNRFGTHTLAFPIDHIKPRGRTGYMTCVRRAVRRHQAEVYLMPLWARLPTIKIPLRPDDRDVPLDVQALIEQCYRNGAYEGTLDYSVDPDPPLLGEEKEWAIKRFQELKLRPAGKPPRRKGKRKP